MEAGYRRYNERDRSQPWPDDETDEFFDRAEALESVGLSERTT